MGEEREREGSEVEGLPARSCSSAFEYPHDAGDGGRDHPQAVGNGRFTGGGAGDGLVDEEGMVFAESSTHREANALIPRPSLPSL